LQFPVGESVPVGYYDRVQGLWVPSQNGASSRSSVALLASRTWIPTAMAWPMLRPYSLPSDQRRERSAGVLYQTGQSLWRISLTHFSAWDANWGWGPPRTPSRLTSQIRHQRTPRRMTRPAVRLHHRLPEPDVGRDGQHRRDPLHPALPERPGAGPHSCEYPADVLSSVSVPASLKRIELEVEVAGRRFTQTSLAVPNQRSTFTWDGQDAYGRTVQGGSRSRPHRVCVRRRVPAGRALRL